MNDQKTVDEIFEKEFKLIDLIYDAVNNSNVTTKEVGLDLIDGLKKEFEKIKDNWFIEYKGNVGQLLGTLAICNTEIAYLNSELTRLNINNEKITDYLGNLLIFFCETAIKEKEYKKQQNMYANFLTIK